MTILATVSDSLIDKKHVVVIPVFEGEAFDQQIKGVDDALKGTLSAMVEKGSLTGKKKSCHLVPTHGLLPCTHVIVVGVGKKESCTNEDLRHAMGTVSRTLQSIKSAEAIIYLQKGIWDSFEYGKALSEGLVLGGYQMTGYTKKDQETTGYTSLEIVASLALSQAFLDGLKVGQVVGQGVNHARDLANTPANLLTPSLYVKRIQELLPSSSGVSIEIIDAQSAKKLGMNLFLGVAQGSTEPPYMVVLRYMPVANQAPIGLVGKGVTFDSGGISIKPANKMSEMKGDMSGSAAVISAMWVVGHVKPAVNVIAVVALTENMVSGNAQRPGDVVVGMNGKTVEIINTDAEGRLVLADALSYIQQQGVKEIVDMATLTGACSVALGDLASAILGNNQSLIDTFLSISEQTGERLWPLPLYDEYLGYLKSEIADIANASEGRLAGTCTGAKFLEQFVEDVAWVHIDIASMMHYSCQSGYRVKGMSGVGVRTLVGYILNNVQ